jgi:HK97 family phage portal protein
MGIFFGPQEKRAATWIPEPPIPPFPGTDISGMVTVQSKPDYALTVPAVWSCIGLLANTVSSLPLQTYRRKPSGTLPEQIDDPPLVKSPSGVMAQSQWLHMLMVSLLLRGNAYGRISARDNMRRATQVDLLNPDDLTVKVDDKTGKLVYRWKATDQPIPADDIWHLPGLTLPGAKVGLSPISYAAATLGIDLGARTFATDFYNGGGIPKAVLKTDQFVDETKARTIKERLLNAVRSREPIVLGAGLDYQTISVQPEESQFLATQQATASQVARFFWIEPEMIGAPGGGSMTYANVEQRNQNFLSVSLQHWLKRIEDGVSSLLPGPQMVEFDVAKLLRTDAETRAKIHLQYVAAKALAPSEIREEMGRPPMTKAQKEEVDLVQLTPTAVGGVRLPQGVAKIEPGPEAPVPALDHQTSAAQLPPQLTGGS